MNTNNENAIVQSGLNKSAVFWNMLGSIMVAGASFLLLMFVTRTVGEASGGVFSLAYTTAQIFLTVGKFGVRSYQSTDVGFKISDGTYLYTRIWFTIGMVILDVLYCLLMGYDFYRTEIFIFVALIKMIDAVEDVFHGEWQRRGRLDRAGQMLFFRNTLTILIFGASMYLTYNLRLSCVITGILSILICFIINMYGAKGICKINIHYNEGEVKLLLKECMPLFLGTFLSLFIYNVPKYIIDLKLNEEMIAVYTIIFMPTFVINMLCDIVFKPMLTMFALWWNDGNVKALRAIILKLLLGVIVLTLLAAVFAFYIGAVILGIIYKTDIVSFRMELLVLMVAGGFAALVYLLYNVLTAMRKQNAILMAYSVTAVLITILSYIFTVKNGLMGSAIAYLISEIFIFTLMLIITLCFIGKKNIGK